MSNFKIYLLRNDGTKQVIASGMDEKKMRKAYDALVKAAVQNYELETP